MLGIPLRLVWNLVANLVALLRMVPRLWQRAPEWVALELEGAIHERAPKRSWLRRARNWSLDGLGRVFDEVAKDARVRGVVIRVRGLELGWARVDSLRELIASLRARGKKVVAHLSGGGNAEWAVASACEEIFADESAPLHLIGMAAEAVFLRETLDRVGVRAELFAIGDYKSAAEMFTQKGMSAANREATTAIVEQLFERLVAATAEGRKLDPARAKEVLCGGPYVAQAAAQAGLVDGVLYFDELFEKLGKPMPVGTYARRRRVKLRWRPLVRRRRAIAVVSLEGIITSGEGGALRRVIGERSSCRALVAVRESPRVAGVVLHVDSRGGDATASDRIWRDVLLLARKKPVVAFLGDVAASGGYYIVAPATRIFAQPGTLTGSIGVIGGKIVFEGLLGKVGVRAERITFGDAAAMQSASRGYSAEERARLDRELRAVYDQFVAKVADGRKAPREKIEEVAQGRVWTGAAARERGLVDELGDLRKAVAACEAAARRREGERFDVVDVRPTPQTGAPLLRRLLAAAPTFEIVPEATLLARARAALLMPFSLRIK
jgi:protease-4